MSMGGCPSQTRNGASTNEQPGSQLVQHFKAIEATARGYVCISRNSLALSNRGPCTVFSSTKEGTDRPGRRIGAESTLFSLCSTRVAFLSSSLLLRLLFISTTTPPFASSSLIQAETTFVLILSWLCLCFDSIHSCTLPLFLSSLLFTRLECCLSSHVARHQSHDGHTRCPQHNLQLVGRLKRPRRVRF